MPVTDRPYDIRLNNHPLFLARKEDLGVGGRAWAVETVGSAVGQPSEQEARYAPYAPTIEIPMVWNSWHRGFGDEEKLDEARYYYCQNLDCRFEGKVFPSLEVKSLALPVGTASGPVKKFVEMRGHLYAFNDDYVFAIDAAGNSIATDYNFTTPPADETRSPIVDACAYNGELIVSFGYQKDAWSMTTAHLGVWGAATWGGGSLWAADALTPVWARMTGVKLGYMVTFRDRLNATSAENQVRWCSQSPQVSTNWTAPYYIGDPGTEITSLGELGEMLYVGKRDGLYALGDDGLAVQITPELRAPEHADNCRNMRGWHGSLWVPHMRGMFAYRSLGSSGFTVTSCSLGSRAGQSSPIRGIATAVTGDDRWLYVALWTGDDTYILAGREVRAGEEVYSPLLWHPLWYLPDERVHSLHIGATGTSPRLWIGAGTGIKYVDLPYGTDNPTQDGSSVYEGDGTLYLSRHSWNSPDTRKLFKSVEILADRLQPSQYIDVWYRPDNLRTWRPVGGSAGSSNRATISPRHVLSFGPSGVAARRIEFRLDIHCSATTAPPILRTVIVRAAERPDAREVITAIVRCADGLPTRNGGRLTETGRTILARLKELAIAGKAVELEDVVGYTRRVIVVHPVSENEVWQQGKLARETHATIRMTPFEANETTELSGAGVYGTAKWGTVADGGTGDVWLDPEQ